MTDPQLQHFGTVYQEIKWWLPMLSAAAVVWKAKAAINGWAEKLFQNHLAHIEEATVSTEKETKNTNILLKDSAGKLDMLQATVHDHQEKELIVWQGVVEALAVLKERTRVCAPSRRKKVK